MTIRTHALAATGAVFVAAAVIAPAQAEKWAVACDRALITATEKGAKGPFEILDIRKVAVKVDTDAKTCALDGAEAAYLKGKAQPVALSPRAEDSKCTLTVTAKGDMFVDIRLVLTGDGAASHIVGVNYQLRKEAPAAGSPEAKAKATIISLFPIQKVKGARIERGTPACVQTKAGA